MLSIRIIFPSIKDLNYPDFSLFYFLSAFSFEEFRLRLNSYNLIISSCFKDNHALTVIRLIDKIVGRFFCMFL